MPDCLSLCPFPSTSGHTWTRNVWFFTLCCGINIAGGSFVLFFLPRCCFEVEDVGPVGLTPHHLRHLHLHRHACVRSFKDFSCIV